MFRMHSSSFFFCMLIVVILVIQIEATYKKPLFNGSIFGKRNAVDYDSTKGLSALCDIASETCQAWYQALEMK